MDIEKMRNIVILKDLPSNLAEEAIVVLKENKMIKKLEYIDYKKENEFTANKEKNSDYVVKEAEMIVSNYLTSLENKRNLPTLELMKKYNKLKCFTCFLGLLLLLSFFLI